jgi:hypothetical protein
MVDPHNMKRHQIISFFDHIAARQQTFDLPEVFRFKTAKMTRKGNKTMDDKDSDDFGADSGPGAGADADDSTSADHGGTADPHTQILGSQPKTNKKAAMKKTAINVNQANAVDTQIGNGSGADNLNARIAGIDHRATNARPQMKRRQKPTKNKAPNDRNHADTVEELTQPDVIGDRPGAGAGADHMTPNARPKPKPKPKKKAPKNVNNVKTGEEVIPPPNNIIGSGADTQNARSAGADPCTNNAHKQPKPKQKPAKKRSAKNIDHADTGDTATGCSSGANAETAVADNSIAIARP